MTFASVPIAARRDVCSVFRVPPLQISLVEAMRFLSLCVFCLLAGRVLADDPAPPPAPLPPVIKAPKEVTGTGSKADPYVFTKSTRCILELVGDVPDLTKLKWDKDDAPSDLEIIASRYASFSLYEDGLHQLTAHGGDIYSKVWFQIHSGLDPPGPTPPGPTPDPQPPEPSPLYVVIIRDSSTLSKVPQAQQLAIRSLKVKDYCATHCLKGKDGQTPEFRIYEPDTDVSLQSAGIQKAFKTAVDDRAKSGDSGPWLAVSNGTTGYSGPVPEDEAKLLEKLQAYGGK